MCLLTVMSPHATPTREQLLQAACNNPHGFGYAIMFDDRIVTGRGMNAEEIIDRFLAIRERCPDTWAMFHHRYSTHGSNTKSNCHPFRVGGDMEVVLAHNGIIPVDIPMGDKRSDTRVFAEDELPYLLDWLDDDDGYKTLEDYIGWSKVCIFSISPRLKDNVYILNESSGTWDNGIWWSNDSYKPSKWQRWGTLRSSWEWDDDDTPKSCEVVPYDNPTRSTSGMSCWWMRSEYQECLYCMAGLSDREWKYGYCENCKSCLECANDILDCDCDRGDLIPQIDPTPHSTYKHWWEEDADDSVIEGVVVG